MPESAMDEAYLVAKNMQDLVELDVVDKNKRIYFSGTELISGNDLILPVDRYLEFLNFLLKYDSMESSNCQ